jgi:hypothetical protein
MGGGLMKYLLTTIVIVFASQAFAEGLDDAFKAALADSEKDHQAQQVAFNVAPDQVEKATFKRSSRVQVVDVPASATIDMPMNPEKNAPAAQPAVQVDDSAQVQEELSDI